MELNLNKEVVRGDLAFPPEMRSRERIKIESSTEIRGIEDIIESRHLGRSLARKMGFSQGSSTLIATVISELARNILLYAKQGKIALAVIRKTGRKGLMIVASDTGPGIENIQDALMSGYSSSGGLGLGLSGVRQIVDEFNIESRFGEGTKVTVVLWSEDQGL